MKERFNYWLKYQIDWAFVVLITGFAIIIFGSYPFMQTMNSYECNQYNEVTGRDTKIVGLNCYIKYDGEWYRYGEIRVIKK
jgi:hypothetical protein